LTDGGIHFRRDGANQFLLRHRPPQAAKAALDFPQVLQFVGEFHVYRRLQ
jgi:hypothetical protein